MATIRNPIEWGADQIKDAAHHLESVGHSIGGDEARREDAAPQVRRFAVADLRDVLAKGVADFAAYRTDVVFLCLIYPIVGLVLARFAFDHNLLPLLFPAASGFALLGPVAAVGLYEMSRRREQGHTATWADAFGAIRSPSFGAILVLGLGLLAIFLLWMGAAQLVHALTWTPEPPEAAAAVGRDIVPTGAGWPMMIVGVGVGFLFAVVVLAIGAVSFPMLLDRDVGIGAAVSTSVSVFTTNPRTMAVWGLIVACGLVLGSIPLFLGLIVVMPVLGHATWHLYRKAVAH